MKTIILIAIASLPLVACEKNVETTESGSAPARETAAQAAVLPATPVEPAAAAEPIAEATATAQEATAQEAVAKPSQVVAKKAAKAPTPAAAAPKAPQAVDAPEAVDEPAVPEDFADSAASQISDDNLEEELLRLERELS